MKPFEGQGGLLARYHRLHRTAGGEVSHETRTPGDVGGDTCSGESRLTGQRRTNPVQRYRGGRDTAGSTPAQGCKTIAHAWRRGSRHAAAISRHMR
jgi:hypothetical protein